MTKLAGALPKGESNGLGVIEGTPVDRPHHVHVLLALVDCSKVTTNMDTGDVEPTARIRAVEVILPDDRDEARAMLQRALDRRLGKDALPFDTQTYIDAAFDGADPRTGEVDDD